MSDLKDISRLLTKVNSYTNSIELDKCIELINNCEECAMHDTFFGYLNNSILVKVSGAILTIREYNIDCDINIGAKNKLLYSRYDIYGTGTLVKPLIKNELSLITSHLKLYLDSDIKNNHKKTFVKIIENIENYGFDNRG